LPHYLGSSRRARLAGRPRAFVVVAAYAAAVVFSSAAVRSRTHRHAGARRCRLLARWPPCAIRVAIDASIFDGCTRANEASRTPPLPNERSTLGLEKAEMAAYWRRQTDVLGTGARAAMFRRSFASVLRGESRRQREGSASPRAARRRIGERPPRMRSGNRLSVLRA
jgi:hypothetical protein